MGTLCSIASGESNTQDAVSEGPYAFFDRSKTIKRSNRYLYDCEALIIPGEGKEFLPKHFEGKFDLHQRAYALFAFSRRLDVRFLYHFLHYRSDYFPSVAVGATVKSLRRRHFEDLPVPVPPLDEQHRIVGILDEALSGTATARANAEANLLNALALFESRLRGVFTQVTNGDPASKPTDGALRRTSLESVPASVRGTSQRESLTEVREDATQTGGREATLRHIPGLFSIAVGMPRTPTRVGWRWVALSEVARLESGHTPSRRHPEYWGGSVPWIGIQDARALHGMRIDATLEYTNELGIANSSARVLPVDTVCLSRTASVGYVVVMGRPMATSQDFVNWVCSRDLVPEFLMYALLAEGRTGLLRFANGSVHQTIYFPEAKAFHICCPDRSEQVRIVSELDSLRRETALVSRVYERKADAVSELREALLRDAFTGRL